MRTDTHRPSVIDPSEYSFVSFHSHRAEDVWVAVAEQEAFRAHMAAHPGAKFSQHSHGGSCHVCGAHAATVARFYHRPTNTYVEVGETCATHLHDGDALNFRSFRERAKAGIEAAVGKRRAEKVLTDNGLDRAWAVYMANEADDGWEESTITDIVSKLIRYGSISDKQTAFLGKLVERIDTRAEREAQRQAETDAASPIPAADGRMHIEGEILTIKEQDGYYGQTIKMLVRHADGWKVWGTMPADLDAERGDRVAFDAKVTISDNDEKFGFFSRPTKAQKY